MATATEQFAGNDTSREVVIEGVSAEVRRIAAGAAVKGQAHGPVVAHLACMRAAGFTVGNYGLLMTVSGYGLCFCYDPGSERGEGAHCVLPNAESRMTEATGFVWRWAPCADTEACWAALTEALDAGRPVRASRGRGLLFVGYRDAPAPPGGPAASDRQVLACSTESGGTRWWRWDELARWCKARGGVDLGWHTRRRFVTSTWEIAPMVMHNAVDWATACPDGVPKDPRVVACGLAGIRAYAADLADLGKDPSYFGQGWLGGPAVRAQWAARRSTADYCMQVIEAFPSGSRAAIAMAATSYRAAYGAWLDWDAHLGHGNPDAWASLEHRRAGALAVRRAARHESDAIAALERALAILEGRG